MGRKQPGKGVCMPQKAVIQSLTSEEITESVQMQMILHCAPVLKNVKVSSMFTIPIGFDRIVCSFLYRTGIRYHCLCRGAKRDLILLYREEKLEEYLNQPQVAEFLVACGYGNSSLKASLRYLGERISWYYNRSQEFPHETGLFLGYPLEDVEGFIRFGGKNYRHIGYWKVYGQVEQAKETFRLYDEAKNTAVAEFFSGKTIREIAC